MCGEYEQMNFFAALKETVRRNDSLVCVGLDPDLAKLPECVKSSATPLFDFNKAIIDATKDYVCAYKDYPGKYWWGKNKVVSYAYSHFDANMRKIDNYKATKFLHCPSDPNFYGVAYGNSYNITAEPMSYGWNERMGNSIFYMTNLNKKKSKT